LFISNVFSTSFHIVYTTIFISPTPDYLIKLLPVWLKHTVVMNKKYYDAGCILVLVFSGKKGCMASMGNFCAEEERG
jgi:hypothetical protein